MAHHVQMMKGLAMNAYKIMMRLKEGIYSRIQAQKLMKNVKEEANEMAKKASVKSIRHHYHTVQHLAKELSKEVRKTRRNRRT